MKKWLFLACIPFALFGCIKDDFIDDLIEPQLRITSSIDTLAIGSSYQLEYVFLDNTGSQKEVDVEWQSSNTSAITVDENGILSAVDFGTSTISASTSNGGSIYADDLYVAAGDNTVIIIEERFGSIATTSSYALTGSFTMETEGSGIKINFADNYAASTALPGLYVYLSNNPNSIAGAYEVGPVETFLGAHSYTIPDVGISDYNYLVYFCAPFNVKVGDGTIN